MAKPELGAKRVCPETGRKFYDLNKDPIVSPYTGQSYPRSYFESGSPTIEEEEEVEDKEAEAEDEGAETISLEEADDEAKGGSDDLEAEDDDVESLHERIKTAERTMLVDAVGRIARDGITVEGRRVRIGAASR